VTITPSTGTFEAGDVLSCAANGYDPTYSWTGIAGVNGDTISESGVDYTLPEGPFYVICTATVSQLSCCDSATIDDTAYSKYINQKQLNTLGTILTRNKTIKAAILIQQKIFLQHKRCTLIARFISSYLRHQCF